MGVVLGVVAHGVKVAGVVGDGVAVGVCAMGVRHGCGCSWCEAAQIVAMVWRSLCALMLCGCGCSWCVAAQIVARVWRSLWRVCSQLRSCPDCELCARINKVQNTLYI